MLTNDDKQYISGEMASQIDKALNKNNEVLIKGVLELFEVTNSRIDAVDKNLGERIDEVNSNLSEKIDRVLEKLEQNDKSIGDHSSRIEEIEKKVFPISA